MRYIFILILSLCAGCYPLNAHQPTGQEQDELDRVLEAWDLLGMPEPRWECVDRVLISWQPPKGLTFWCHKKGLVGCYLPVRNLIIIDDTLPLDHPERMSSAWDVLRHEYTHHMADCARLYREDGQNHSDLRLWSVDPFILWKNEELFLFPMGVYPTARAIAREELE